MADPLNNELVDALILDRKRDRRWRNIRFFIMVLFALLYTFLLVSPSQQDADEPGFNPKKPYVSLVRLNGEIAEDKSFSANKVVPLLTRAFADKQSKGVVLAINSPGGSPVQASIIHDKILYLKNKYPKKKVTVVASDALASGAYLVATAADKIYVNEDTLTGSIGVIMSGFGFEDTLKKIGVTRRLFTAGKNKARMDPFEPLNPADVAKMRTVLDDVHQHFINDVVQGRKNKLRGNPSELFSGDFWIGDRAVELGIADGIANVWEVLKSDYNVTQYKNFSPRPSFLNAFVKGVDSELNLGLTHETSPLREEL